MTTYEVDIKHLERDEKIHDTFRKKLEKPVFDKLRELYLEPLRATWLSGTGFSSNPARTIFIYETRCHDNLEFIIYNAYYFTKGWAMLIYCTEEVEEYVRRIVGQNAGTIQFVHISKVVNSSIEEEVSQNKNAYNNLLTSFDFWKDMDARGIEYFFLIEMDSYLRKPLSVSVEKFDYIASEWPWSPNSPGGGGISIRRVKKAIEIFESTDKASAIQDGWFSDGIEFGVGGTVENKVTFVECSEFTDPCGIHQWWTFVLPFDEEHLDKFVEYMTFKMKNDEN